MTEAVEITFRDMEESPALRARIMEKVQRLEQLFGEMITCRVAVERRHHRHHQGNRFSVGFDVSLPGAEIVVSKDHDLDGAHEDPYVALRDAYRAARRQIREYQRKRREGKNSRPSD